MGRISTISFNCRIKTGSPRNLFHFGEAGRGNALKDLPSEGLLFPYLARVRPRRIGGDSVQAAVEVSLNFKGVTLAFSYRFMLGRSGLRSRWLS